MIVDHLFLFPDESTAHDVLDPLGFGYPEQEIEPGWFMPAGWDGSRVLPCRVIMGWEDRSYTDPDTGETYTWQADVYMSGFHINVTLSDPDPALMAIEACVLVTDRELSVPGALRSEFILMTKVSPETMDAVKGITPVFAGTAYPFGVPDEQALAMRSTA